MTVAANSVVGALATGGRLHEYEILRVLGHGGFGITYLVHDHHLDKNFAIKEYLPTELAVRDDSQSITVRAQDAREAFEWGRAQFIKEARVLARFNHPNLIDVHRFFEANQTAYFVMEYAEGVTLEQVLKQEHSISEARLRAVIDPILDGLEVVHKAGVLHRDIKPGNIILRSDGTPVLIDFGAARLTLGSMTRSTMNLVTAGYAPIEQYSTDSSQGPWTDLYALGAVAYRSLLGRRPADSINRLRQDPLEPAAAAGRSVGTPHFLAAIDWAMAVHEKDRPQSIADWRPALSGAKAPPRANAVAAKPSSPAVLAPAAEDEATELLVHGPLAEPVAVPSTPKLSKQKLLALAAALLVLVVVVETAWLLGAGRNQDLPPAATEPAPVVRIEESAPVIPAQTPAPPEVVAPAASSSVPFEIAEAPAQPPPAVPAGSAPSPAPAPKVAAAKPAKQRALPAVVKPRSLAVMKPLTTFQDCPTCPLMVVIPSGRFVMGATGVAEWEAPPHEVRIGYSFALGRFEVTAAEWQACVKDRRCPQKATAASRLPVIGINFTAAQAYADWLTTKSGRRYRLPTEAEWEYALRGGSISSRFWGDKRSDQCLYVNGADRSTRKRLGQGAIADCNDGHAERAPAGSLQANAFGLHDMAGNVWEWVQDCWSENYVGAPNNGSARVQKGCPQRVTRGGSWGTRPESFRSAARGHSKPDLQGDDLGFRVAAD